MDWGVRRQDFVTDAAVGLKTAEFSRGAARRESLLTMEQRRRRHPERMISVVKVFRAEWV
jgi:hypothetical protein